MIDQDVTNPQANDGDTTGNQDSKGRFVPGNKANTVGLFSQTNQPSGENKSNGKKMKRISREAIGKMLSMKIKFPANSPKRQELVEAFGEKKVDKANGYELAIMSQMLLAVKANDTTAFKELMNQHFGQLQKMEHTGPGGGPIQSETKKVVTRTVIIRNPHAATVQ